MNLWNRKGRVYYPSLQVRKYVLREVIRLKVSKVIKGRAIIFKSIPVPNSSDCLISYSVIFQLLVLSFS